MNPYTITLTDGATFDVYALEQDGPGNISTPRQIIRSILNGGAGTNYFVLSGDLTYRFIPGFSFDVLTIDPLAFPQSANEGTYTVAPGGATLTGSIEFETIDVIPTITFSIIGVTPGPGGVGTSWTISGKHTSRFIPGESFFISGNVGLGLPLSFTYTVFSSVVVGENTLITVNESIAVTATSDGQATQGKTWIINGESASSFSVGAPFNIQGTEAGNGSYQVESALNGVGETIVNVTGHISPAPYSIVGVTSGPGGVGTSWTISGDQTASFLMGQTFVVSDNNGLNSWLNGINLTPPTLNNIFSFTVSVNSILNAGNTEITVVEAINAAANATGTVLSATGNGEAIIPNGSTASPAIYGIIGVITGVSGQWIIAGNHAQSFTTGSKVEVSNNLGAGVDGSYTIASATNIGNTTVFTVVGTIPATATASGIIGVVIATALPITAVVPRGSYIINGVTLGAVGVGYWSISGNHVNDFGLGTTFNVTENNGGDGLYRVVAPGAAIAGPSTRIVVEKLPTNGPIPVTATSAGYISVQSYAISAVIPGVGGTWTVTGQVASRLPTGATFDVAGNTDLPSNGTYLVATATDGVGVTDIVVTGTIPATAVADGTVGAGPNPIGYVQYTIPVADGGVNTSLILPGRGTPNWGQALEQDLVRILENSANVTPPPAPLDGQIWADTSVGSPPALFMFGSTLYDVIAVNVGTNTWTISGNHVADFAAGNVISVYGNAGISNIVTTNTVMFEVQSVVLNGSDTDITIDTTPVAADPFSSVLTAIPPSATGDGKLYNMTDWYQLVTGGRQMYQDIDMGGNSICNMNPIPSGPSCAITSGYGDLTFLRLDGTNTPTANLDIGNFRLTNVGDPVNPQDGMTLSYANTNYVNVSGDTMTGNLNIPSTISTDPGSTATSKDYVDGLIGGVRWLEPVLEVDYMFYNSRDPNVIDGPPYATIVGSTPGAGGQIIVSYEETDRFVDGYQFTVTNSTFLNGTYTVAPAGSTWNCGTDQTTINVIEVVPAGAPDGRAQIRVIKHEAYTVAPRNFTVVSVITGLGGTWSILGNVASRFAIGDEFFIVGDSGAGADGTYTVVSATNVGPNTDVVVNETIPVTAVGDGELWHVRDEWNGFPGGTVVCWNGTIWKDVIGRPLVIGDRLGLRIEPDDYPARARSGGYSIPEAGFYGAVVVVNNAGGVGTHYFEVVGAVTSYFITDHTFDVVCSTGNNGSYTVVSSSVVGPNTRIVVAEAVPSAVADGALRWCGCGRVLTVLTANSYPFTYTWDVYTPLNLDAVFVSNQNSLHFGHSYTFNADLPPSTPTWGAGTYGTDYRWIEFSAPLVYEDGPGIYLGGPTNLEISVQTNSPSAVATLTGTTFIDSVTNAVEVNITTLDGEYLRLDGNNAFTGTVNPYLDMGNTNQIINLADPTNLQDAVTVNYLNNQAIPYDILFTLLGVITTGINSLVGSFIAPRTVFIKQSTLTTTIKARSRTAPTVSNQTFVIRKYDTLNVLTDIASVLFTIGSTTGTVTALAGSDVTLAVGDMVEIYTDATNIDPSISNVTMIVVGCAVASPCSMV